MVNVGQVFLNCYAIAQSRDDLADLGEDGISAVGLTLAQHLLDDMDPVDAVWKTRAAERDFLRQGWNEEQEDPDVFEALVSGVMAAFEGDDDEHIDLRWIANNAIAEAEENGDHKRAYAIAVAREDWEQQVPGNEWPQPMYKTVVRNSDNLGIVEAYAQFAEEIVALGKERGGYGSQTREMIEVEVTKDAAIVRAEFKTLGEHAVAASSTGLGYSDELDRHTRQQLIAENILSEEAERELPVYLRLEWEFDFGNVEEAANKSSGLAVEAAEYWLIMHDAERTIEYGLWWLQEGPGRSKGWDTRQCGFDRVNTLRKIQVQHREWFDDTITDIEPLADGLSPSELASFCNQVARHAVSAADENVAGMLYGSVRAKLSEALVTFDDDIGGQTVAPVALTNGQVASIPHLEISGHPVWMAMACIIAGSHAVRKYVPTSAVHEDLQCLLGRRGNVPSVLGEEVYSRLFPGRDTDGDPLTFTKEQQAEALDAFIDSIEEKVSPSDPDWKIYKCERWRKLGATKALQGREAFEAVKDAVKSELTEVCTNKSCRKRGEHSHYIHEDTRAAWRESFAAKRVRDAQVTPTKLYESGVTVSMSDGQSRFIPWDSFLSGSMRSKSLTVPDEKRESFITALTSIGGEAEKVARRLS